MNKLNLLKLSRGEVRELSNVRWRGKDQRAGQHVFQVDS